MRKMRCVSRRVPYLCVDIIGRMVEFNRYIVPAAVTSISYSPAIFSKRTEVFPFVQLLRHYDCIHTAFWTTVGNIADKI